MKQFCFLMIMFRLLCVMRSNSSNKCFGSQKMAFKLTFLKSSTVNLESNQLARVTSSMIPVEQTKTHQAERG